MAHEHGMTLMGSALDAVKQTHALFKHAHEHGMTALRMLMRHKDITRKVGDTHAMNRHHTISDEKSGTDVYNIILRNGIDDSHEGAMVTAEVAMNAAELAARGLSEEEVFREATRHLNASNTVTATFKTLVNTIFHVARSPTADTPVARTRRGMLGRAPLWSSSRIGGDHQRCPTHQLSRGRWNRRGTPQEQDVSQAPSTTARESRR